jgi:hypothetical protein
MLLHTKEGRRETLTQVFQPRNADLERGGERLSMPAPSTWNARRNMLDMEKLGFLEERKMPLRAPNCNKIHEEQRLRSQARFQRDSEPLMRLDVHDARPIIDDPGNTTKLKAEYAAARRKLWSTSYTRRPPGPFPAERLNKPQKLSITSLCVFHVDRVYLLARNIVPVPLRHPEGGLVWLCR